VVGLNPNLDTHETYIDIDPYTGVTMRAHKRVQLNIQTHPLSFPKMGWKELLPGWLGEGVVKCMEHPMEWDFVDPLGEGAGLYVPMMWYDEYYEQPQTVRHDVNQVYMATTISKVINLGGIVVGMVGLSGAVVCLAVAAYRRRRARREASLREPLLVQ